MRERGLSVVTGRFEVIYLAPHLDDVALGAGAQLARDAASRGRALVLTVFAGVDEGMRLEDREVVRRRRREDVRACRHLGVSHQHLEFVDARYRRANGGCLLYPELGDVIGEPRAADGALGARIRTALSATVGRTAVVAPAALSAHVDHRLVFDAARGLDLVAYYDDFPFFAGDAAPRVSRVNSALGSSALEVVETDADRIRRKTEAVLMYESQLGLLFGGEHAVPRALATRAEAIGGERIWRPSSIHARE